MLKAGMLSVVSLTLMAATAMAQDSNLDGPISGLLLDDQSRSIRPIVGMPGSAYAGYASVSDFDFASVAPDARTALIARGTSLYLIRRLDAGVPVWRELTNEASGVSLVSWGENSDSLAVVNSAATQLDLWTGLASDPKRAASLDLSSLSDRIVVLAVAKDASYVFAATRTAADNSEAGSLYLLKPGAEPVMIMPLVKAGGLFLNEDSLYVTDRGRNEISRVTNWKMNPSVVTVASAGHGLNDPVGAALSPDRRMLYIANAGTNQLLGLDLASSSVKASLDLGFQPTRLERLGMGSYFLLDKGVPGEAPAQVLDANTQLVYFIPISVSTGE